MANIFPRGKYYYLRFYDKLVGYSRYISTGCPTTREGRTLALKKLREYQAQMFLNRFDPLSGGFHQKPERTPIKISEGFKLFCQAREDEGTPLSPATLSSYTLALDKLYLATGDCYCHTLNRDVNQLLTQVFDKKGLSKNSRAIYTRSLRSIFNYLLEEGFIKVNHIKATQPLDKDPEPIPLEDIQTMLEYLKTREKEEEEAHTSWSESYRQAHGLIKLLALTGLRISEADALNWKDINLKEDYMTVKNIKMKRNDKFFPISQELHDHLLTLSPKDEGKVFGHFTNKRSIRRLWDTMQEKLKTAKKIKEVYTIHQLRKTTSSVLTESEVTHVSTQKYIRHKNFQTTLDHYAKMRSKAIKKEIDAKTKFNLK